MVQLFRVTSYWIIDCSMLGGGGCHFSNAIVRKQLSPMLRSVASQTEANRSRLEP